MARPYDGWLRPTTSEDHVGVGMKVRMDGIDYGGPGTVLAVNEEVIAVKWPGSMGWGGIGQARVYHSPDVAVYRIQTNAGAMLDCRGLIEWSLARKAKP